MHLLHKRHVISETIQVRRGINYLIKTNILRQRCLIMLNKIEKFILCRVKVLRYYQQTLMQVYFKY